MCQIKNRADPRCFEAQKELEKIITTLQQLLNHSVGPRKRGSVEIRAVINRLKALRTRFRYQSDKNIDWLAVIGIIVSIADLVERIWH
jgi:ElaB/YqjD/DUF883 family membrane-anchored ribosome-binding protein